MNSSKFCLLSVALGLLVSLPVSASTVLYYRFGDQPDTSGYLVGSVGPALTNASSAVYDLPETGAGSQFPNPVPFNAAANTKAASFTVDAARLSADTGQLGLGGSFTIEAFVNLTSFSTSTRMIASQWVTTGDQRGWTFGVGTDQKLRLTVSANGINGFALILDQSFLLNNDYYVAAAFDNGNVTFYQRNLTTGASMVTASLAHVDGNPTSVLNSTATFQIGNFNTGAGNTNQVWRGVIDEVRLSNIALGANDLMVAPIPEPTTYSLLAAMSALGAAFCRRRGVKSSVSG